MKKSSIGILVGLALLAGCSTPPIPPVGHGVGNEPVTIAYGKVINVKEYSQVYGEVTSTPKQPEAKAHKTPLGKNYQYGRPVAEDCLDQQVIQNPEPILSMNMIELHIRNEQGPTFKIDQVKNGSYYMGQRVKITMKGNVTTVTPY